jgi:diguanylate cyclase (GGDEF)-like protein
MSRNRLRHALFAKRDGSIVFPPARVSERAQKKRPASEALEAILSSRLVTGEELSPLLRKLDEISDALGSTARNSAALRRSLRDAVVCAVGQAVAQRELCALALTDDLTGLYNRRGFLAAAAQQLKLARRETLDSLLFFADVDNLKAINDRYGHCEGDLALARVADALESTLRDSDVLGRLGGDEFAALATNSSSNDRETILRRLAKNLTRVNSTDQRYQISLSVGVARFDPRHPASLGELVTQADRLMYEQKMSRLSHRPVAAIAAAP